MPCLIFGPVSSDPAYQRRGLGKRLVDRSLELAAGMGYDCVCVEGDIAFYGKCGFVVAGGKGIRGIRAARGRGFKPLPAAGAALRRALRQDRALCHPRRVQCQRERSRGIRLALPSKTKLCLPGQAGIKNAPASLRSGGRCFSQLRLKVALFYPAYLAAEQSKCPAYHGGQHEAYQHQAEVVEPGGVDRGRTLSNGGPRSD